MAPTCPRCGVPRLQASRFCGNCGLQFDASPPAAPTSFTERYRGTDWEAAAEPARPAAQSEAAEAAAFIARVAGAAWIGAAGLTAFLALLQWQYATYADVIPALGDLRLVAAWNGIAALVTLYFGARLVVVPTRGALGASLIWGVLSALWGIYQLSQGATHVAFVGATALYVVASVLSLVAYAQTPPEPATERKGGHERVVYVVIGTLIVVAVGGILILGTSSLTPATGAAPTLAAAAPSVATVGSLAPPSGAVWFGKTFDTTTWEVHDQYGAAHLSDEVAIVAHFDRTAEQSARFEVLAGTTLVYQETVPLSEPTDLYGFRIVIGGLTDFGTGTFLFRFRDAGGTIVARGILNVIS